MPRPLSRTHLVAMAVAGTALALTLAACGGSEPGTDPGPTTAVSATEDVTTHNDADTQFAQAMIVHHEGAIAMADLAAQDTADDQIRELAEGISAAQGPEIDLMTGWLEAWGEETSASMPGMDHDGMDMDGMTMDGMTQDEAMTELEDASGADRDRRFLELMIAHHQGAITMAEQELADGTNADALALANKIVADQTAEITTMQNLLAGR